MTIVFSVLIVAAILVCFSMPERFCENTRIPQLYLNSHVWFAVAYLVIFYQFQLCLYYMFKYDEQVYDDNGGKPQERTKYVDTGGR